MENNLKRMLLQEVIRVAIDLYSGRLRLSDEELGLFQSKMAEAVELTSASPESPLSLTVHGESRAGGALPGPLPAGAAMRIFTGAPLPEGADTVVMQEDTSRDGDAVRTPNRTCHNQRHRRPGLPELLVQGFAFLFLGWLS